MKKRIYISLVLCAALFSACTEDFRDWAAPQHYDKETVQTTELKSIVVPDEIKLGEVEGELVKLFSAEVASSEPADVTYQVILEHEGNKVTIMADENGCVTKDELQSAVTGLFGNVPVVRDVDATVYALFRHNGQSVRQSARTTLHIVPASSYTQYLWVPGEASSWGFEGGRLESPNFDGHYSGYIYVKGGFKFTDEAGWNGTNYGWGADAHSLSSDGSAGNLWISDEAAVYYVNVDLVNMAYTYTEVETMGIVGDFNGWNNDVVMIWDATDKCFVAENANIMSGGWKFRLNNGWDINLGANDSTEPSSKIDDLVKDGKNLGLYGNTVRLYPLRDKSDKIYCTVE